MDYYVMDKNIKEIGNSFKIVEVSLIVKLVKITLIDFVKNCSICIYIQSIIVLEVNNLIFKDNLEEGMRNRIVSDKNHISILNNEESWDLIDPIQNDMLN